LGSKKKTVEGEKKDTKNQNSTLPGEKKSWSGSTGEWGGGRGGDSPKKKMYSFRR